MGVRSLFSALFVRFLFLLLLLSDLIWMSYNALLFVFATQGLLFTGFRSEFFAKLHNHACVCLKRSLVSALALFVTLFSPAFGIMIACTYFMMYDPEAVDELVPQFLREHFRELT